MTASADESHSAAPSSSCAEPPDIYYFGYGPIVNAAVRERRGVQTSHHQAALLPEHRLTFAYGGVANIVPARGFTVQGILMKVSSEKDWENLKQFDAGQYEPQLLQVFPYQAINHELDDPVDALDPALATKAHVFVMRDFDETKLEKPIEKKPQERYLKLITQGMLRHGADQTYVQDEIMACPYIPNRQPEHWYSFAQKYEKLPTITFEKYHKMCRRAAADDLYFIMHRAVLKADAHDPANPSSQWMRHHAHGKQDVSFMVHTIVVDPDLPFCETPDGMTALHYLWAENHIFEFLQQAGITATKVFQLTDNNNNNNNNNGNEGGGGGAGAGGGWRQSLRTSFRTSLTRGHRKPSSS